MQLRKIWISAILGGGLAFGFPAVVQADDFLEVSLEVPGGGMMGIAFSKSWGSPIVESTPGVINLKFGPHGPKKKPFFSAHIAALTANATIPPEALMQLTQKEISEVREISMETNIPISDVKGEHSSGHYFSITDRESKFGEFDYLTLAVIGSEQLLVKTYFFSNDGAPDFGEDAIRLMKSIKYTAPPPPEPDIESEAEAAPDAS
jgi:hypothetical protein